MEISSLLGKTIVSIKGEKGDKEMLFSTSDGKNYRFFHDQDCCELVRIEDITGDLQDLIGEPLLRAEEESNNEGFSPVPEYLDSWTWTFYKFSTRKGYVDIRWLGESNGYYGEKVELEEVQ